MSRRFAISIVSSPLSAALSWCKRVTSRIFRYGDRIVCRSGPWRDDKFEAMQEARLSHSLQVQFCGELIKLNELTAALRIGDRVRLFCDDGVLVAEKISQTRLKVIHSETVADLIH